MFGRCVPVCVDDDLYSYLCEDQIKEQFERIELASSLRWPEFQLRLGVRCFVVMLKEGCLKKMQVQAAISMDMCARARSLIDRGIKQ